MTARTRTLRGGEPRVQWTTRNLPTRLLAEARLIAAMTDLLPGPGRARSVESVINGALEVGLPTVRRTVEREVKTTPAPPRKQRARDLDEP
jgi:hypothetical protein